MTIKTLHQLAYEKVLDTDVNLFNLKPFCNMYKVDWDDISENYNMSKHFLVKHFDNINFFNFLNNDKVPFSIGLFRDSIKFYDKNNYRTKQRLDLESPLYDIDFSDENIKREIEQQLYAENVIEDIRNLFIKNDSRIE